MNPLLHIWKAIYLKISKSTLLDCQFKNEVISNADFYSLYCVKDQKSQLSIKGISIPYDREASSFSKVPVLHIRKYPPVALQGEAWRV